MFPLGVPLALLALLLGAAVFDRHTLTVGHPSPSGGRGFTFVATDFQGDPARWRGCDPIHYVVNLGLAPAGAMDDVREAVGRVSEASGITFVFDGRTSELPSEERGTQVPGRYGDRFAPVLIAWTEPGSTDLPTGNVVTDYVGMARPLEDPAAPKPTLVTGWVAIRSDEIQGMGFHGPYSEGLVLMHELGHIVGMGHSTSPENVMYSGAFPDLSVSSWGPGDVAGLHVLGRQGSCPTTR